MLTPYNYMELARRCDFLMKKRAKGNKNYLVKIIDRIIIGLNAYKTKIHGPSDVKLMHIEEQCSMPITSGNMVIFEAINTVDYLKSYTIKKHDIVMISHFRMLTFGTNRCDSLRR